ncbi:MULTISPECIES: urea transporter [Pseudomonas]|jgi:urea transporter|uniref:Putative transporter n=1 Tax=Pseudomonas putida TaxID=303 RepID=A0A379KLN2_PSEPU|nr:MULTISPECIES: urea transporter [Pseudomonas]QPN43981.1 urea transporter [Priestia aryabhattai]KAF1306325.1 urea transporter [Pseudomonas sp. SG-MS2]MBG6127039.1 urea transporter [Pseudomonas sp. M2]MBM7396993.1 urea transporter [Pseudomonas sp. M5]NSX21506.1 urea transporter [Pseudomonas putida]
MYTKNFVNPCPDWATALLNGFSQVLLLRSPLCGLCCLLAILLTAPDLVGGALLGALAGLLTAQRRGYDRADRQAGLYCYNGVLIGILICAVLPWSAIMPPLIIAAGGLSSIITHQWRKRGGKLLIAYTAPFVLLGWGTLLLASPSPSGFVEADPLYALARGVGQIFLLDQPLAGLLIILGMFIANPYAAMWAVIGSAIGGSVALFAEAQSAWLGLYGFNAALAALAFSRQGEKPWVTLLAIALALLLQPLFKLLPVPGLTAPFVAACWLMHLGSHLAQPRQRNARRLHS